MKRGTTSTDRMPMMTTTIMISMNEKPPFDLSAAPTACSLFFSVVPILRMYILPVFSIDAGRRVTGS